MASVVPGCTAALVAFRFGRGKLWLVAEYTVNFNYSALHQTFSARTGRILERAAFALTQIPAAEKHLGLLPNVQGPAIPVRLPPRPLKEIQAETERWVVTSALRDCIEEVSLFLEKTREMCAAISLFDGNEVSAERWNDTVVRKAKPFHRKNFPQKVECLLQEYGSDILPATREFILTLNSARNCLVHRHGVVGTEDGGSGGTLTVKWKSFELHGRHPDGSEFPLVVPQTLVAQTQVFMRYGTVERMFKLGDAISFTPADLSGIWLTLHFFGATTAANVVKLAKAKGLVVEEPKAPIGPAATAESTE